jgi:protein-L-isoaspartate(D-aspartate) O-methyltransferase
MEKRRTCLALIMQVSCLLFFTLVPAYLQVAKPKIKEEAWSIKKREEMVNEQIKKRGVKDERVLLAMQQVPRHLFVPQEYQKQAYEDYPLPIGDGQTISQPYIVAFMTEMAQIKPGHKVLEIGTGSGYQAAILSILTDRVFTIEIKENLARKAAKTLSALGFKNIQIRCGDGYAGWPEEAPFDSIIVTCAAEHIPPALFQQLKEGGRMIIPLGDPEGNQVLALVRKIKGKAEVKELLGVRFVPMIHKD